MKDIRNYFGAKPKNGTENGTRKEKNDSKPSKKRPKPVVISSDSEEEVDKKKESDKTIMTKKKPKRAAVLSDSGNCICNKKRFLISQKFFKGCTHMQRLIKNDKKYVCFY